MSEEQQQPAVEVAQQLVESKPAKKRAYVRDAAKRFKGKPGPPSKCTPDLLKRVAKMARLGMNLRMIADALGLTDITLIKWKKIHEQFSKTIEKNAALAVKDRLGRIEKAGKRGVWVADAWYLERKHPEEFGRRPEEQRRDDGRPIVIVWPHQVGSGEKAVKVIDAKEIKQVEQGAEQQQT